MSLLLEAQHWRDDGASASPDWHHRKSVDTPSVLFSLPLSTMRAAIISMLAMPPCLAFQQTPPLQIRRRLTAVAGTGAAFTSCRRLKSSCSGSHSRHPLLLQRPSMSDDAAAAEAYSDQVKK